jgi:hypothetical protein
LRRGRGRREEGDATAVDMHQVSGVGGGDPERTAERGDGGKGGNSRQADTAAPGWEWQPGESSDAGDKWWTSGLARIGTTKHEDSKVPLVQGDGFDCGELVAQPVTAGGEPRLLLLRTKVGPAVRVVVVGAAGEGCRPLREAGDTAVAASGGGVVVVSRYGKGQPG